MTGPIKPTGGPPVPDASLGGAAEGVGRPETESADFRATLAAEAAPAPSGTGALPTELAELAGEVAAGRLTPSEAVDALVERALSSPMARGLAPAARAGLEAHLRAALANDPVLGQMVADLSRVR